ncbi:MAG: glutamate--tRNA ligase [Spirochaetales bacterium]|nr:glutamate--tRNA ligase [Spirochaetales bacterium]MCF7937059.1 glutamate--tRNA ligase [Spirochaetales bacterium]
MSVRVRYAPSPTGLQHIGGVRTALFNYFFARAAGGSFILRIEDTDRERYSDESLDDLYRTLDWLGLSWDEGPQVGGEYGPYVQSQRFELYREHAHRLVEAGRAYPCYCSSERLEEVRRKQKEEKSSIFGYDRHCRDLTPEQRAEYEDQGIKPVIRFKVPMEGETSFEDVLLDKVKRKNRDISPDPVILKSDGFPTYHLANVVDDHLMKISHILRAQEWISSGPLHVLLYEAFGWDPPVYCHLPMVMGKDGQKLSKRHGSTSVRDFRLQGYLPEAIINYVSLLGWSYDDSREFFRKEELEKVFSLEKLNKAPAVFDYKKLDWFNGNYIRELDDDVLQKQIRPYLIEAGFLSDPPTPEQEELISEIIPLIKERLSRLAEVPELVRFLFQDPAEYDAQLLVPKKTDPAKTMEMLRAVRGLIQNFSENSDEELEDEFRNLAEQLEVKLGQLLMPLRVSITGSKVSPPLFGAMRILGEQEVTKRIDRGIGYLERLAETNK